MITLGSDAKDNITGFAGIVTGRTEWLFGCIKVFIEPKEMKDGKPIEGQWFDEQRIVLIEKKQPVVSENSTAKTGGPHHDFNPKSMNPKT